MRLIADRLGGERGGQPVFSGVGFALAAGDGLIVTGPNGAGKSTLLRVLAGLLPAAEGSVRVEDGGEDFATPSAACHYLGHLNAMKTTLTVFENLRFWREFARAPSAEVGEALDTVGLGGIGDLPFAYLSTGQRRRAAFAKLLVSHRPIWLLDEPTAGLDAESERRFSGLMQAHLQAGGILVAATHQPLGLEGVEALEMGLVTNA